MKKTSKTNKLISVLTAMVTVFTFVTFALSNSTLNASAHGFPDVKVEAHVQNIGWLSPVYSGKMAGTTGRSLQLECLKLTIVDSDDYDGLIYMYTHQANIGWVDTSNALGQNTAYRQNGSSEIGPIISGTVGETRAIEAVVIGLSGPIAGYYDIRYKVHVQNLGWLDWKYNGQQAGTTGQGLRMEAIRVELVPKGYRDEAIFRPKFSR